MATGLLYDPIFLTHDTGRGHPECKERLLVCMEYLRRQDGFAALVPVASRRADPEQVEWVHDARYIQALRAACRTGASYFHSMDVMISRDSYDIALQVVGSGLQLVDAILQGQIGNGFALLRPPGHHAERDKALGFCLFNTIAIIGRYLQRVHALDKILIIDWDVHHGNGTQHIFESDPSVLYISLHQFPFYPGTGDYTETGEGRGIGSTLNCPMPAGAGNSQYEVAFSEQILPKIDAFSPDIILISAGFDAHIDDPLADIHLSTDCYAWMTRRLMEKAAQHCEGRILSLLEGGYHWQRLAECIAVHVATLQAGD